MASCKEVHSGFKLSCALHLGNFSSKHRFSLGHYLNYNGVMIAMTRGQVNDIFQTRPRVMPVPERRCAGSRLRKNDAQDHLPVLVLGWFQSPVPLDFILCYDYLIFIYNHLFPEEIEPYEF